MEVYDYIGNHNQQDNQEGSLDKNKMYKVPVNPCQ